MSKVLLVSDIHVHPHKKKADRLKDCLECLDWVFQVARKHDVDEILFGGDLLHDRSKIDVLTYTKVYEVLRNNCTGKIKFYLLLGNHDLWYNDCTSVSSVTPFQSLPGVTIIDGIERRTVGGVKWDFIPFTHDPITALETLGEYDEPAKYCLGHLSIDGAKLNSAGTISDVVIEHDGEMVPVSAKLFDRYEYTFLGHYHSSQILNGKVEYIGSPLQLSFGEAFQDKHVIILDCETGDKEYIQNEFSPRHYYLRADQLDKYDLKGAFVTLICDDMSAVDVAKLRRELLSAKGAATVNVRQLHKKVEDETHVIQDALAILQSEDKMLERYIKEAGCEGLVEPRLLDFGKRIIEHEEAA